jgi:hypothetical protein
MSDNSFEFNLYYINNSNNISNESLFNKDEPLSFNLDENIELFNNGNIFEERTTLYNFENNYNYNQNIVNEAPIKESLKIENNSNFKTQETTLIEGKKSTQNEANKNLLESKAKDNDKLLNKKRKNKSKNSSNGEKHSKFSSDNTLRKIKHITLENVRNLINEKIKEIYNNNIGLGISKKKLLTLNQSQKVDATIDFNKQFIDKKLYEIFSDKISTRYTSYPGDFNKNLIKNLMNEKDLNKREYFQKLFNLSFLDCLSHFRGSKNIKELTGLKSFSEYINEEENDEYYKNQLEYYINDFENILQKKRSRKRRENGQNKGDQESQEELVKSIMIDRIC